MSLEGRLEDLGLPDIFQIINLSKRSGVLTLVKKDGMGRVVFNQGNVTFASSDNKSRFGYVLLQKNIIQRSDLERALEIQKARTAKTPIGTVLAELGSIEKETVETELRLHIIDVVRDLLTWTTGTFQFTLGKPLEGSVIMQAGLSAEFLLLEGARLDDESGPGDGSDLEFHTTGDETPPEDVDEMTPMTPPGLDDSAEHSLAGLVGDDDGGDRSFAAPLPSGRKDLDLLPSMIEELGGAVSGHDVILMMLRFASELMDRAVVFLVRGDTVAGWGQFGVDVPEGSADEMVRAIAVSLADASSFRDVAQLRSTYKGPWLETPGNDLVVRQLGGTRPVECFLAPVLTAGRVVAFLYGDNLVRSNPIGDTEGLEAFIRVAAAALGKTVLQQQISKAEAGGR